MLENLITSKTRIRILVKFFINSANDGYLRGLSEEMHESTNSIRKELNNLEQAGYLKKQAIQNRVFYKANTSHPLFNTLKKIIFQHIGLDSLVAMVLERMGAVKKIVVIGDYAKGIDSGTIEVVILGANLDMDYIEQLPGKIEKQIKRKILIYTRCEFETPGLVIYEDEELIEYNSKKLSNSKTNA
jgi:hypothetical protein